MGFAHGLGRPPSFDSFAECKGAFSSGSLQASVPEALFGELSASTEPPTGLGSTVSKQRPPPRPNGKGTGPAADCCVSGPVFFDYTFLCDSDDEELAGIVELCHSSSKSSHTPRRPRTPLLTFVGKNAPTRKARTQLWRTRWPSPTKNSGLVLKKGLGCPDPPLQSRVLRCSTRGACPPRPVPRPHLGARAPTKEIRESLQQAALCAPTDHCPEPGMQHH